MQALFCVAAVAAALLVALFASAHRLMGSGAKPQGNQHAVTPHFHLSIDNAQAKSSQASRVHRHNSRWWNWMCDRSSVVWQRGRWVFYQARVFTDESMATRQPAWRFSSNLQIAYAYVDPRFYQSPSPHGVIQSICNATSKANFNNNPYGGGMQ